MTVTSNPIWLHVNKPGPLEQTGLSIEIRDASDLTTRIATLNQYTELVISPQLSNQGTGSVTLDLDAPFFRTTLENGEPATSILDREYLWACLQDGRERFAFLGTTIEEHLVDTDGTRTVVVSGDGSAGAMKWAVVLPPNFPNNKPYKVSVDPNTVIDQTDVYGGFYPKYPYTWPMMKMWLDQLRQAQKRGTVPWISPMFNAGHDSAGAAWEVVQTPTSHYQPEDEYRLDNGTNYLDLLATQTGQDNTQYGAERLEWFMWPGFKLDVRKRIGVHRENKVIFDEGVTLSKQWTRRRDQIVNYIATLNSVSQSTLATDSKSVKKWNRRESYQSDNANMRDANIVAKIGQVNLLESNDEVPEWTIVVPYDLPGRKPFVDYHIGDWIGIVNYDLVTKNSYVDAFRIVAISLTDNTDGISVELTAQSAADLMLIQLQREIIRLKNTILPNTLSNLTDVNIPFGSIGTGGGFTLAPGGGVTVGGSGVGTTPLGHGGFSNISVFIQSTDPGEQAKVGDFWYDTSDDSGITPIPTPSTSPWDSEGLSSPSTSDWSAFNFVPNSDLLWATYPPQVQIPGTNVYFYATPSGS